MSFIKNTVTKVSNFIGSPLGTYLMGAAVVTTVFVACERSDRKFTERAISYYKKGLNDAKKFQELGITDVDVLDDSLLNCYLISPKKIGAVEEKPCENCDICAENEPEKPVSDE